MALGTNLRLELRDPGFSICFDANSKYKDLCRFVQPVYLIGTQASIW